MAVMSDAPRFAPKWPELESLPKGQVRFTYDRPSDTLYVDFYGKARPASSEPLDVGDRDYLFVRVDPQTDEVVGVQIESFLAYAVKQHPYFVEVLEVADLHGYDDLEAANLRRWAREQSHELADGYDLISAVGRMGA